MGFRWLAYIRKNFTGKFSTREKCQQATTNTRWNDGSKATLNNGSTNDVK